MELRQYWAIAFRWKWLIIGCTLLAAVSAFVTSLLQVPVYEATTTLLISEAPKENVTDYTAILTSERLARTYAEMLTNQPVLQETLARLEITLTADEYEAFEKAVDVQLVRDTQLITVSVEDPSPDRAASLANTLAQVFSEQNEALQQARFAASKQSLSEELQAMSQLIQATELAIEHIGEPATNGERSERAQLEANLAQYRQSYTSLLQSYEALRISEAQAISNVVQVEAASVPADPVRPRTMVNTLLAAVGGAMLAVGVAFLIEYLDTTIKTPDQAMEALELPLLGMIGRIEDGQEGEPLVASQPRSPIAEAFRKLRTNIEFCAVDRPIRTLVISSPSPGDGKSTIAANMAVVMAQSGKNVVLLDADMRRPRIHRLLALPNRVGLSDLFTREPLRLDGAVRTWRSENLAVITTGPLPPNPAELLGSQRMADILAALESRSGMVIIDSPPISSVVDAVVTASKADAVLMVIEPKQTPLAAAKQALEQLRLAGAHVIGLAFNNVKPDRSGYYDGYYSGYYYHYYDYYYAEDGKKSHKRHKRREEAKAVSDER